MLFTPSPDMLPELIKSAMIGTAKYTPAGYSPLLQEVGGKIAATASDKEDAFLKLTAAYLLLEEAGKKPQQNDFRHTAAPAEPKPFIAAEAMALLKQLLVAKEEVLLDYFMYRCISKGKVVRHELLPELLQLAADKKQKRERLLTICGTRGTWLSGVNPQWQELPAPPDAEIWETGTLEQRKTLIRNLRQTDPQQARELLQANLQEETANNRAELLDLLHLNLSLADEPYLTTHLSDRSLRVKQVAGDLLKALPGTRLHTLVQEFVKDGLHVKEERVLLLGRKKVLEINQQATLAEELFAAGFEKVSSEKGVEDLPYWLSQAISYLPPDFWQEHYGLAAADTVKLFASHKEKKLWLPALVQAAYRHKHIELATALLQHDEVTTATLLQVLPLEQRLPFAEKFPGQQAAHFVEALFDETYSAVPAPTHTYLMQQVTLHPYLLSQQQYQRWALHMPPQMLPVLQQQAMQESNDYQQRYARNQFQEMSRIIQLKQAINASI